MKWDTFICVVQKAANKPRLISINFFFSLAVQLIIRLIVCCLIIRIQFNHQNMKSMIYCHR